MGEPPVGHVKLSRKIFESDAEWLAPREFSRFEAWVYLIQLAAWRPRQFVTRQFGSVDLQRGEFVASRRHLAKQLGWTEMTVRVWLAQAERSGRIATQRTTQAGTVYLIVNYDTYQSSPSSNDTANNPATTQRQPKKEAVKAVKQELQTPDGVEIVIAHYLRLHPRRRPGEPDRRLIARRLGTYSPAELCEALDGNAGDKWCAEKAKHELEYVLRNNGNIDSFREKAKPKTPTIRVVDGWFADAV